MQKNKSEKGKITVAVGMSGGVDSSVSALLLKEQGYNVVGMFMKNWDEQNEDNICTTTQDFEDVAAVCERIKIPYYPINFVNEYWERVFSAFIEEFKQGFTPNPDILCNREIKFKVFLQKALELGADYLATGHYCRNQETRNTYCLLKGSDPTKDQSYFLYTMNQNALQKVWFPVGNLQKHEVRKIAQDFGLATAKKKDSTGVCFIGERNFKTFLSQYLATQKGDFVDLSGRIVGKHDGIAYYTIGQRRGMGIGGPGEAWFVVDKDPSHNIVYLAQGEKHPALYYDDLIAYDLTWISGEPPLTLPFRCQAKIRYRQADQPCSIVSIENGRAWITFDIPQRAVTPRQSIVFYQGERCLGGGIIQCAGSSYYQQKKNLPNLVSE